MPYLSAHNRPPHLPTSARDEAFEARKAALRLRHHAALNASAAGYPPLAAPEQLTGEQTQSTAALLRGCGSVQGAGLASSRLRLS